MTLKEITEEVTKRIKAKYKAFYFACQEDDDALEIIQGAFERLDPKGVGRSDSAFVEWSYAYGCVTNVNGCFADGQTGSDKSLHHAIGTWLSNRTIKADAKAVCAEVEKTLELKRASADEKVSKLADALSRRVGRVKGMCASVYIVRDVHLLFEAASRGDVSAYRDVASLKGFIKSFEYEDDPREMPVVFLVGQNAKLPQLLDPYVTMYEIAQPTEDEIAELIAEKDEGIEKQLARRYAKQLRGLGRLAIEHLLDYITNEKIKDTASLIYNEKKQQIQKSRVLDLVDARVNRDDVGGLNSLMNWLEERGKIFKAIDAAEKAGVDTPKGVLIVGMPGCGKSLVAKITAKVLGVQLLRMDMGSLMGKYVGESEENMRRALQLASAASPCVLWVDEIEKAFAGVSSAHSGSEIATRLFGYFLTWMQEKTEPVFVVATANRIDLPPELFRRGRFDDIFYVDFPKRDEAVSILKLHLAKRLKDRVDEADLENVCETIVDKMKRDKRELVYAGSDIEALAATAVERLYLESRSVGKLQSTLEEIVRDNVIRPIGETMKDEIESAREKFRKMGLRPASI